MCRRIVAFLICIMLVVTIVPLQGLAESTDASAPKAAQNSGINWICPYCSAELRSQAGFNNETTVWTCKSCGNEIVFPTKDMEGFDPVESFKGARFPGIYWYCDGCGSFLNQQEGFDDHLDCWECTVCGHVNPIADEAIIDEKPEAVTDMTDGSDQEGNGETSESEGDASSGNTLLFGHYEQDGNLLNGPEPIEWIILDQTESSSMLISKDPLDYKAYNEKKGDITWEGCSLRAWLNGEFMDSAFYPIELASIAMTEVDNGGNQTVGSEWETQGGRSTQDQVFLLSYAEYAQYIDDDSIELNSFVKDAGADGIFSDNATWWLRSPGKVQNNACFAGNSKIESAVVTDKRCIRPVIWLVDTAYDWDNDYATRAMNAYDFAKQGKYAEAVAITDMLGNYWGSKLDSIDYRLMAGDAEFEAGNYSEANKWYAAARDFTNENFEPEDAIKLVRETGVNEQLLECRYQHALSVKQDGDIDGALELLTEIGQYKDSMDLILECMDQKKIQRTWLTKKIGSAVNAGKDTGFSKTNDIGEKDPHFGWSLGRFLISGYTDRQDDGEIPVFYKTPGDNLILWFNLEQDITALNGNENLTIARDKDGFDKQFQISKSDFGRGALIIQHTDVKSHEETDPIRYFDYLAASDDTGADTRVEIKEEGTYQVALDYEIAKKDKIAVVEKTDYFDYRIAFTFEVRHGGNMFFLFDLATQSELDDYSTTVDGFRIDLANSQSLQVEYTRYTINQSGTALDARKDTLAGANAEFSKVGYYEITVTNKETGKGLTKHVFVGRAADLEEYKEVDSETMAKFG